MTSEFVQVKSATIDSRSGVDVNVEFYTKDRCISTDDIGNSLKQYIKMSAWYHTDVIH